jgi:hypothetical protein
MKPPKYLEIADSSLVAIRAVAAAIDGRHCDPFERRWFEQVVGRWLNRLSVRRRKAVLRMLTSTMGVAPRLASTVDEDEILRWALSLYDYEREQAFDAVIVGAPNGGVAHLASLLRAPFLTQHYLLAFRGRYAPDDSRAQFDDGVEASRRILARNPHMEAVVHYDPLHDRFLITRVNYIRLKLRRLPPAYRDFITKRLRPGGTVVSVECRYPWLQYPVECESGKLSFQVGGLGDVPPNEYLDDSERLREYRRAEGGNPDAGWGIPDIEPVESPESEWGSVGNLADEVRDFCASNGYRLVEISFAHPEEFSLLAFRAYRAAMKLAGEQLNTVLFDCFTHIDPRLNLITHVPSVWLPFICRDSFRFAGRVAEELPKACRIWLSLHPSFCDPFDLAPLDDWRALFSGFKSLDLVGVDPDKYPADLTTYLEFARATKRLAETRKRPFALAIDADMLQKVIKGIGDAKGSS